ncbi:hypothetical protein NT6N_35710 [Oceaniferula spumae]|uniref:DUF4332 domain-containing protein n=1 Tax=Oceaniferula spumae TaxID=2979115 RepID=A0AAT9FR77_9BACT
MPKLQDISDLPSEAAELLEAVGYLDAEDLAEANLSDLHSELVKANSKLHILSESPDQETVAEWQSLVTGSPPAPVEAEVTAPVEETEQEPAPEETEEEAVVAPEPAATVKQSAGVTNFEEDPEVIEMLAISPEAVPLPGALIKRNKLAVADIPEGILLTECEGEVEINVLTTSRMSEAQRKAEDAKRTGLMTSRIRGFDQVNNDDHVVKPLDRGEKRESVSVSEGLNAGLNPESRRFVRGVLHPDPISVRTSAFFALLVQLFLAANLIGIPWLLIHEHLSGDSMLWWVVGISSGLLLSALCYLFWGLSARCRVCGQRQFAPKKCLKNKKAHHIPLIGYILPTAVHALFYKWFYCTYCGTAVRLKK